MTSICKLEQLLKIYTDLESLSICHFLSSDLAVAHTMAGNYQIW